MQLAKLVVRRRGWIGLGWLVLAGLLLPQAGRVTDFLEAGTRIDGSQSKAVEQLLAGPLASAYARFVVLVVGGVPSPSEPAGTAVLRRIVESLAQAPEVSGTLSYLNSADTLFLASGGSGTFVVVGVSTAGTSPGEVMLPLRAVTEGLAVRLGVEYPGVTLRWTGESALNFDLLRTNTADVRLAERRAVPVTTILLLLAFGAVCAALMPVAAGALAIAIALGAAAILAQHWSLAILLQSVVSMLGLGLGIDYALLMVSRFREASAAGSAPVAAAETAAANAGSTIILSAATVAIGFLALLIVPLNEMRAVAVGGLLVVISSALVATTLLPGLLAWLGPRIEWGRVRRLGDRAASTEHYYRLGRLITAHPWTALALGAAPLLLLAAASSRLHTGLPRGEWLPQSMESARAHTELVAMGRNGVMQTVRVVLELPEGVSARRSAGWSALARLDSALGRDPRVARVRSIVDVAGGAGMGRSALTFLPDSETRGLVSADGRLALLELLPDESVTPEDLVTLVRELRSTGAEPAGISGARLLVGGLSAYNTDYQDAVAGRFPQIVALVVSGTLLALFFGVRSVLVPLKAVVLNLLSVAAAFGALTLVFQDGHGSRLFGVAEPLGAVFAALPVIVFCIVFGLSMDYEVFLVMRVREAKLAGHGDREAIIEALGTTGQVITSAAAIMLAVFVVFTGGEVLVIKMLGFTLSVAVFLDATVVRMVIGPALLQLAGNWNWWPGPAGKLE